MIYYILTLICAISNLLCLVNIQAWQLDLEGCWWKPLPRVQKRHMLRLPTHRQALHRAVSVGWKPVNMHLFFIFCILVDIDGKTKTLICAKSFESHWATARVMTSHINYNRCLQWKKCTQTTAKQRIKGAQVMKKNKNLQCCFDLDCMTCSVHF